MNNLIRRAAEALRQMLGGKPLSDEQKRAKLAVREADVKAEIQRAREVRAKHLQMMDRTLERIERDKADLDARIAQKRRPGG